SRASSIQVPDSCRRPPRGRKEGVVDMGRGRSIARGRRAFVLRETTRSSTAQYGGGPGTGASRRAGPVLSTADRRCARGSLLDLGRDRVRHVLLVGVEAEDLELD